MNTCREMQYSDMQAFFEDEKFAGPFLLSLDIACVEVWFNCYEPHQFEFYLLCEDDAYYGRCEIPWVEKSQYESMVHLQNTFESTASIRMEDFDIFLELKNGDSCVSLKLEDANVGLAMEA